MPTPTENKIQKVMDLVRSLGAGEPGKLTKIVDSTNGSDSNEGNRYNPLATIQAAVDAIEDYGGHGDIAVVGAGTYDENVTVTNPGISIYGLSMDTVKILPTTGTPLTIAGTGCSINNIWVESVDDHAIEVTGDFFKLKNSYVEINANSKYSIWLDDSDDTLIESCVIEGNNKQDIIGVLVGDGTIRTRVLDSTIQDFGSGITDGGSKNGYAIGLHGNSQQAEIYNNHLTESYVGIYAYAASVVQVHTICENVFSMNASYDIYDNNSHATAANSWDGNCYMYTSAGVPWYQDNDHDGLAEKIISAGSKYDAAPLASPHSRRIVRSPRLI